MNYNYRPQPKKRSWWQKIMSFVFKAIIVFLVVSLAAVLVYRVVPVPLTPLMVLRSAESLITTDKKFVGIKKDWVPLSEIHKSMQRAVIKAEDYRFYEHSGFDWQAIEKAMKYNKTHKRKKGASTISQQTAKNVFLWPSRSWLRKGLEAYFTVLIELFWPKDRILEVYLNVIELGEGVYGVEAASQKFFKKKAAQLNNSQASLLAAVLPNPRRFKVDRPSAYVLRRQAKIMSRKAPPTELKAEIKSSAPRPEILPAPPADPVDDIDLKLDSDPTENEGDGNSDNSEATS